MQTTKLSLGSRISIFLMVLLGFHVTFGQGVQNPVPKEVRTNSDGSLHVRYGYQEYLPIGYDTQPDEKWPLIIHMVGVGERGNGTIQDLDTIAGIGLSKLVDRGKDYPFLIMSPQPTGDPKVYPTGPSGKFVPDTLGVFIDYILENYNVDPNRVYITAFSAAAIEAAKYIASNTAKVAAFMPIAGNVRSYFFQKTFCNLADIPVWAFHNQFDPRISLSGSKEFVKELKACTPAPIVRPRLTVYPGNTHDAWTKTYNGSGMGTELVDQDYDAFDISVFNWFLKYSKDKAVIADAGSDQYITLPTDSAVLEGIGRPITGVTYQWVQVGSTPSVATLSGQNTDTLTASKLVAGIYEFEFIVTDAQNNIDRDTARVIVKSFVADAGNNITVTLPIDSVQLSGQVRTNELDPNQTFTYQWTQVDGPDSLLANGETIDIMAVIKDPTVATTSASGFKAGVYQFEFAVTDNSGAVARDYVQVTVKNNNNALVANAGNDTTVVLPVEEVILRGSGSDTVNQIVSYSWTQISGNQNLVLQNTDSLALEITNLTRGVYEFVFTVNNDNGGSASDTVVLTVRNPLEANAGKDTTVTLPVEQIEITGSGSDVSYEIVSYAWKKISGPEVTISGEDQTTLVLSNLQKGTYEFEFTVTNDNNEEAKDTVAVLVVTTNDSLVADAGEDMIISLPQESVEIAGSGSDPFNEIIGYQWQKISGPEVTLAGEDQPTLILSGLQEGTYEFELTVTNNNEGVAKDTVVLTACMAPTIAPIEDVTTSPEDMPLEVQLDISNADLSSANISAVSDNQVLISDENIEVVIENGEAKLVLTANTDTSGSANITVTAGENCESSQQFKITVNPITGVEDELEDLAIVYPNPSDGVFLMRWKETIPKGAEISVLTNQGSLIKRFQVKEAQREFTIDLNTTVKGTYLLQVRVNNKIRSYRIIKQ